MVTIRVCHERAGKAATDKKFEVYLNVGPASGWTNRSGDVDLDVRLGSGKVWVNGHMVYGDNVSGRTTVFLYLVALLISKHKPLLVLGSI